MFWLEGTIDKEFDDILAENGILVIPKVKV